VRPELDPGQDGNGYQQQPWGEQEVRHEAEDGQGDDGDEDKGNRCFHVSSLPPTGFAVDRDQPWFAP
jgi:hypothetical protein